MNEKIIDDLAWWAIPIIPATGEVERGELWCNAWEKS
jgi:hypothetical protein